MSDTPEPVEPEERRCEICGGPYDQPPADSHIPVCTNCLRAQSWPRDRSNEVRSSDGELAGEVDPSVAAFLAPPTEHPARLTR